MSIFYNRNAINALNNSAGFTSDGATPPTPTRQKQTSEQAVTHQCTPLSNLNAQPQAVTKHWALFSGLNRHPFSFIALEPCFLRMPVTEDVWNMVKYNLKLLLLFMWSQTDSMMSVWDQGSLRGQIVDVIKCLSERICRSEHVCAEYRGYHKHYRLLSIFSSTSDRK